MKTKTKAPAPLFFALALLLALFSCGEQSLTGAQGPKGDQGSQGDQGRSAQAWLQTDEGQAWLHGTTIEAWMAWINSPQGKSWLASPEGKAWLASAAGQAWQEWMDGPEGKEWLAKFSAKGWLETQEGKEWLAKAVNDSWLMQPSVQDWLETPEGQAWLAKLAINAWHAYIQSPDGQEWLASMQLEPDIMAWIDWLSGPEGLEWLKSDEGQFWLTGQLSCLEQPSPVASTIARQSVFSDIDYIYLIGEWNSDELSMASFSWEKASGPGNPVIANPASPVTSVSGLEVGEYTFKFTVLNLQGESDSAVASVSVAKKPSSYQFQEFLSDGTFTVPEGITKIYVSACGGGSGGYASHYPKPKLTGAGSTYGGTIGGGGASAIYKEEFSVTPGQQYSISIGGAGKGGVYNPSTEISTAPTSGGDTAFTLLLPNSLTLNIFTLKGGALSGKSGGYGGGDTNYPGVSANSGTHYSIAYIYTSATTYFGGGGSLGGGGGAAYTLINPDESIPKGGFSCFIIPGTNTTANGSPSSPNHGGNGNFGGGGGAGCSFNENSISYGGDGGPGYCLIEWWY